MSDTKISALSAVSSMANANEFAVNESGTSKKVSGTQLKDWLGATIRNVSTAAQSPAAGATTYLAGSSLSVPTALLRAGTYFRWKLIATKTAAGTAASSVLVKIGAAGTTADATIVTQSLGAGTAAADTVAITLTLVIRSIGAAATSYSSTELIHQNSTTGFVSANETQVFSAAGSAFDSTTASLIVGLAWTAGASVAATFQIVTAEAYNL